MRNGESPDSSIHYGPEAESVFTPLDFYELTEDGLRVLAQRVEANGGVVVALIHPYSEESKQDFEDYYPVKRTDKQKVRDQISGLLKNARPDGPPMFLFEPSGSDAAATMKRASGYLSDAGSQVYVIRTRADSPEPHRPHTRYVELPEEKNINWNELNQKFTDLGVKKIVVAGLNLAIDPENKRYDDGCVLEVAKRMSPKFKIKLSSFTYPNSRETIESLPNRKSDFEDYL